MLSKGLKFIPTPQKSNIKKVILNDFDEFARKLRCKYHFDKGENLPIHPFKKPSGYNPPFTCYALEDYIDKTKLELSSIPIKKIHNNTSKLEREALTSLRNNNNIVIKIADKIQVLLWTKTIILQRPCVNLNQNSTRKLINKIYITCIKSYKIE